MEHFVVFWSRLTVDECPKLFGFTKNLQRMPVIFALLQKMRFFCKKQVLEDFYTPFFVTR